MSKLSEYRPFGNIAPSHVHGKVAHLVIIPNICLKPPCEEYTTMVMTVLETHFSNLPKINTTSALETKQLFAVSFICGEDNIIFDL